jgi:hypothetical protein
MSTDPFLASLDDTQLASRMNQPTSHRRWRQNVASGVSPGIQHQLELKLAFNEGSTPEEIAHQYTTLNLADIYAVISCYLQNQDEVVEYLERRKMQRAEVKEEVESQFDPQGIRDRLLARKRSDVTG